MPARFTAARSSNKGFMNPASSSPTRSITESPWYWAYLFCTGGLIALVIVGPKYARRQTQIEQNGQKRQWAARVAAGQAETDSPPTRGEPSITLWPLFVVLGAVLAVAWIKLIRDHLKRRAESAEPTGAASVAEQGGETRLVEGPPGERAPGERAKLDGGSP